MNYFDNLSITNIIIILLLELSILYFAKVFFIHIGKKLDKELFLNLMFIFLIK